jgi:hypothetical protein
MNLKRILAVMAREIADEADRNAAFRERLEGALGVPRQTSRKPTERQKGDGETTDNTKRAGNRRAAAVLDPIHLAKQGEDVLRRALQRLDIEQLRDVVAEYGMDTGKLVMKWRSADRIADRIVELARQRAQKGSAFRDHQPDDTPTG